MVFSNKSSLRKYLLEKRLAMTAERRSIASYNLCRQITALDEFKASDTVLLFYPLKNEPNLINVMEKAIELKKTVAFPISLTDTCTLSFHIVSSLSELSVGAYGIREPSCNMPKPIITNASLCIAPALAADLRGYRIGYGKGYYDRFLSDFEGVSLCVLTEGFLYDALPTEPTDVPVDILVTETEAIRIQRK